MHEFPQGLPFVQWGGPFVPDALADAIFVELLLVVVVVVVAIEPPLAAGAFAVVVLVLAAPEHMAFFAILPDASWHRPLASRV